MSIGRLLSFVIILAILGGIGFLAFTQGSAYLEERTLEDAGETFLQTIKRGDYAAAFQLSDPNFQSQTVNLAGFQTIFTVTGQNFSPDTWSFHDTVIETDTGTLNASIQETDGDRMGLVMNFTRINGMWLLSHLEFVFS